MAEAAPAIALHNRAKKLDRECAFNDYPSNPTTVIGWLAGLEYHSGSRFSLQSDRRLSTRSRPIIKMDV